MFLKGARSIGLAVLFVLALTASNVAQADTCGQIISGASTAPYQGQYGSAGGDGYCHARTGNEPNTTAAINSQADCQSLTGSLFVEFDADHGKNFNDCIFTPPQPSTNPSGDSGQTGTGSVCGAISKAWLSGVVPSDPEPTVYN